MTAPRSRPGFTFLLVVLAVGMIVLLISVTLIRTSATLQETALLEKDWRQAFENARSCADWGIMSLRKDPTYSGYETRTLGAGTCAVDGIGGTGTSNRTVCVEGTSGSATRRIEIRIDSLSPSFLVSIWRETPSFTLCSS